MTLFIDFFHFHTFQIRNLLIYHFHAPNSMFICHYRHCLHYICFDQFVAYSIDSRIVYKRRLNTHQMKDFIVDDWQTFIDSNLVVKFIRKYFEFCGILIIWQDFNYSIMSKEESKGEELGRLLKDGMLFLKYIIVIALFKWRIDNF